MPLPSPIRATKLQILSTKTHLTPCVLVGGYHMFRRYKLTMTEPLKPVLNRLGVRRTQLSCEEPIRGPWSTNPLCVWTPELSICNIWTERKWNCLMFYMCVCAHVCVCTAALEWRPAAKGPSVIFTVLCWHGLPRIQFPSKKCLFLPRKSTLPLEWSQWWSYQDFPQIFIKTMMCLQRHQIKVAQVTVTLTARHSVPVTCFRSPFF